MSWHWVRKLLHSPGDSSYLSGGGRRGLWMPRLGAGRGGAEPESVGAGVDTELLTKPFAILFIYTNDTTCRLSLFNNASSGAYQT